ncbi:hypothetical protein K523DRAFT_324457 [Schizophyllum commune Tattone D]|nr:hypothetical protein K523DRAFT_324457 [Schizophyllum commune Tattone D]
MLKADPYILALKTIMRTAGILARVSREFSMLEDVLRRRSSTTMVRGCVLIGTLVAFVTALRKTTTPGHLELVHLCQYDVTITTYLRVIPLALSI